MNIIGTIHNNKKSTCQNVRKHLKLLRSLSSCCCCCSSMSAVVAVVVIVTFLIVADFLFVVVTLWYFFTKSTSKSRRNSQSAVPCLLLLPSECFVGLSPCCANFTLSFSHCCYVRGGGEAKGMKYS